MLGAPGYYHTRRSAARRLNKFADDTGVIQSVQEGIRNRGFNMEELERFGHAEIARVESAIRVVEIEIDIYLQLQKIFPERAEKDMVWIFLQMLPKMTIRFPWLDNFEKKYELNYGLVAMGYPVQKTLEILKQQLADQKQRLQGARAQQNSEAQPDHGPTQLQQDTSLQILRLQPSS